MGIDIHWFIECSENPSEWKFMDGDIPLPEPRQSPRVYDGRNRDFFAQIGRPTPGRTPVFASRGLPADVSPVIRGFSEETGEYGVDHSWLTLDELESLPDKDPVLESVLAAIREASAGEAVRVVFWFDR